MKMGYISLSLSPPESFNVKVQPAKMVGDRQSLCRKIITMKSINLTINGVIFIILQGLIWARHLPWNIYMVSLIISLGFECDKNNWRLQKSIWKNAAHQFQQDI